jgi:Holliday junction DNA helicase RuvA
MIGSLRGKIIKKGDKYLILEVLGVGYRVNISPDTLSKVSGQKETFLFIHTHIREDAFDLYGFLTQEELEFFEMLITISGIGPKGALTILAVASIDILEKAIGSGDVGYLTKISGIGKKTAEKMVLELKDKLVDKAKSEKGENYLRDELDTLEALKSLGYTQNEARDALKNISSEMNTNEKIREALKILSKK